MDFRTSRLAFGLIFISALAFGQGDRYPNTPSMKARSDGALVAASATVAVCLQPANTTTQPCSVLATLYTDATLATPCTGTLKDGTVAGATNCSNPLITDSKGNYHFYANPGAYTIQVYGSGITTSVEPDVPVGNGGAVAATILNGDLWVGSGSGQYSSIAACNTAAVAGQTCHIPGGWSETFAANLTLKSQVCLIFHGLATINMSTFSIVGPAGVPPCIKSFGLASSTSAGPGANLYLKYFGTGVALDIGTAVSDTRGGDLEGIFIELTAAGANAIGVRLRRLQGAYLNSVIVTGSGANAGTQLGWLLDGTGTFIGNNTYESCGSNGTSVSMRMTVGNLNKILGGNWSTATASGIGFDLQNAEGNLIEGVDVESTFNAVNFANSATVTNNIFWNAFLQSNTTDVTIGAGAKYNIVHNAQAGAMTVTDNSAATNFNSVWGPTMGWRVNSAGQFAFSQGTAALPILSSATNGSGFFWNGSDTCWSNGSFSEFCLVGLPGLQTRANGIFGWVASGDPDGSALVTGISQGSNGVVDIGTGAAASTAGYIKTAQTLQVTGSNFTTSSATLVAVTGLTFTAPASAATNWNFHCDLIYSQATAAAANLWGIITTQTAPTNLEAWGKVYINQTGATPVHNNALITTAASTTIITATPSAFGAIGTNADMFQAEIEGGLEAPSNASPTKVAIAVATGSASDAITIYRGSGCWWY